MEHRAPAPPKHGETQTHFGPLRHPDGDPPHHRDGEGRNRGPPHASGSSSAYSSMRESGSARRARAGPPAFSNIFGTKRSASGGERVPCGKGAHDTSVSLLPPPTWSLAAPWTPTRWPATAAPATAWSLGLTGSAPGWAVGAHMCGRKRMARRTSARGATFMAAIAAL